MKKTFIILFLFALCCSLYAQPYTYVQATGTNQPYDFDEDDYTTILKGPADNILSPWQTLPFTFNFFGTPVTGYYASDNGYITFDSSDTLSIPSNDLPPSIGKPNNAIYAFWTDLRLDSVVGSAPDEIKTWTYGVTPNRTHVIQWYSVTDPGGGPISNFIYFAIKLYECGDFDIILNRKGTGVSTLFATAGCENASGTTAKIIFGSPIIDFPATVSTPVDDNVYRFFYTPQATYDLSVVLADVPDLVGLGDNVSFSGLVENRGSATISSFDLYYTVNGGAAQLASYALLSIAPNGGTYYFTHTVPWNVTTSLQFNNIKLWAANPNSNPDGLNCNDTFPVQTYSNEGITASKYVLIEEYTGAWSLFEPDARYVSDTLESKYPNLIPVVIHAGTSLDNMKITEGLALADAFAGGYPESAIDRLFYFGENSVSIPRILWNSKISARFNENTPVAVNIFNNYNDTTRMLNAQVDLDFVDSPIPGDMRVSLFIVEDSVIESGIGYDQQNFYNLQAGHPYFGAGNPILGYPHRHVLRAVPSGTWGTAGIIANTPTKDSFYSVSYNNIPINVAWDDKNIRVVAAVSYYDSDVRSRSVLNSFSRDIQDTTFWTDIDHNNFNQNEALAGIQVYPNPSKGLKYIKVDFDKETQAKFEVFNLNGKQLATLKEAVFAPGRHAIFFDIRDIPAGIYLIKMITDKTIQTGKIVVIK